MRIQGTVKVINASKGVGFNAAEAGGQDVCLHATALEFAVLASLTDGDDVDFVREDYK